MTSPIGVPGPIRVSRSFASRVSTRFLLFSFAGEPALMAKEYFVPLARRFVYCQTQLQRCLRPVHIVRSQGRIARPGGIHQVQLRRSVALRPVRTRGERDVFPTARGVDGHPSWRLADVAL